MNRTKRLFVFGAFATLGGCMFLTQFNPEGQPCDPNDSNPITNCLTDAGYWCVKGECRKGPPPDTTWDGGTDGGGSSDAGYDAGRDAGTDAGADSGFDAGPDAGTDAGKTDGGCDGGKDAGKDAGKDGGC